jgi:hypothetical protein
VEERVTIDAPAIRSEAAAEQEIENLRSTVAALDAKLAETKSEREASMVGLREGLSVIDRAAEILDVDWERLTRDELLTLMSRTLSFLHNGPEMIRACVVGSIPRDPEVSP